MKKVLIVLAAVIAVIVVVDYVDDCLCKDMVSCEMLLC